MIYSCRESCPSTANGRTCGGCGCEYHDAGTNENVVSVKEKPLCSLSELTQDILHVESPSFLMEPSTMLQSQGFWLIGWLAYIGGILGFLGTCLPLIHVNRHEILNEVNNVENRRPAVLLNVDDSDVAERCVLYFPTVVSSQ